MEPKTREEQSRVWELYARSYDRVLPILPFYKEVVQRHVTALSVPSVKRVVDIGAGTGNVAVALAARGVQVTAIDVSPAMLHKLNRKVEAAPSLQVEIVERDAASLQPWGDGAFDGANALLALFAMQRPRDALSEMIRVLRSGGRLVVTEPKRTFDLETLLDFVVLFLEDQGLVGELGDDWDRVRDANRRIDPRSREDHLPIEDVVLLLREAGFAIDRVEDSHLGQCATAWATKAGAPA